MNYVHKRTALKYLSGGRSVFSKNLLSPQVKWRAYSTPHNAVATAAVVARPSVRGSRAVLGSAQKSTSINKMMSNELLANGAMLFYKPSGQLVTMTPSDVPQSMLEHGDLSTIKSVRSAKDLIESIRIRDLVSVLPMPVVVDHGTSLPKPAETILPNIFKAHDFQVSKHVEQLKRLPKCYMMLSKIRLTALVVLTEMGGYAMAPELFDSNVFVLAALGTCGLSCAANTINQFFEVPYDSQMDRTKHRVLVRGLITSRHAVAFAATCATLGLSTLYYGVNGITASLGLLNLILYTLVYTPMKRVSIANTWFGSIVGAIPPIMGWTACTGTLDAGGLLLGAILYAWQFPHFNALSWNLRSDYSRAGYRMMSVCNQDLCCRTSLRYSVVLTALCSVVAPLIELTSWTFAVTSLPINAYLTYLAWKFRREADSASSRLLFRFSLVHLPALMLLLLLCKKQDRKQSEVT